MKYITITCQCNTLQFFMAVKNDNFQMRYFDFFLFLLETKFVGTRGADWCGGSVADYGSMGPWFETWPRHSLLWPSANYIYPLLSTG